MPKRHSEDDLDNIVRKMKKLERKINRMKNDCSAGTSSVQDQPTPNVAQLSATPAPALGPDDWLPDPDVSQDPVVAHSSEGDYEAYFENAEVLVPNSSPAAVQIVTEPVEPAVIPNELPPTSTDGPPASAGPPVLDTDILNILGEDPSVPNKYGPDLREELATRLQHIATAGLTKEQRKDILAKYPLPSNCLLVGSPSINPEIKAAIPPTVASRDKGIEMKQKQMAAAISCLSELINTQINSNDKNKDMLQKLMDTARMLCDLQHADSVTRRNFILFTIKKELKEHLSNTKIDSQLFGEQLADTLKSAKAVSKSGSELKADSAKKTNPNPRRLVNTPKNLNRKAPPARRPPVQITRSYEPPPASRAQQAPPPPPAHSSRTWPRQAPPPRAPEETRNRGRRH